MKASELIKELENQIKYQGDLNVSCCINEQSWYMIRRVSYNEDDEIELECC